LYFKNINNALQVVILRQVWPPAEHGMVRLGQALETLCKLNPFFETFGVTVVRLALFNVRRLKDKKRAVELFTCLGDVESVPGPYFMGYPWTP
jgi:hypothetical protein